MLTNRNVFISHSNNTLEVALASRLTACFRGTTFSPVLAEDVTTPLSPLAQKVKTLIDSCGCFMAIVTPNAHDSQWVQQELGYAYQRHSQRDKPIAVLVQEGQSLGGFYTGLEYFVFREETFDRTVRDAIRYFEKVERGDLELELKVEDDDALREMVDTLRSETKTTATHELLQHIGPMLDRIITQFATAFLDPELGIMSRSGLDNFSMRTETFVDLMTELAATMTEQQFGRALTRAGVTAGRSFGADFCDQVLLKNRVAVASYKDLIGFWLYYDQTSGWGVPKYAHKNFPSVAIEFTNSFLVRKTPRKLSHAYCTFLAGYIDGFLQFTLRRVSRSLGETGQRFRDKTYSPDTVAHSHIDDHTCHFAVACRVESSSLSDAFDHLFSAELANASGDSVRCLNHARAAMEFGVKGQLGIAVGAHNSFHEMMKQLFEGPRAQALLDSFHSVKYYRELYGDMSASIHQLVEPDEAECRKIILAVDEFLNALERTEGA
jgi:TIR domain-containing protein